MRDPYKNYHKMFKYGYSHCFEFGEFLEILKTNLNEVAFYEGVQDYRNGVYKGEFRGRLYHDKPYSYGYNFAEYVIRTEKRLDLYLEVNTGNTRASVFCEYYRFLNGYS